MILTKGIQKLIASGLALLFTLSAMCVMVWALLSTEQMGLSVSVSYTSPVTAKVYLATNSSTAGTFRQYSPTVDGEGGPTFDKAKSALIFNTYDSDTNGGLNKTAFEQLGAGTNNGLKCDANGEMEFYVYVENYSETDQFFTKANITFTGTNGTAPFTVESNPTSLTEKASAEATPSKSVLTYKISSDTLTGLNTNTIQIEISLKPPIYGVMRELADTDSAWTRTDDSVGLVANANKLSSATGFVPAQDDFAMAIHGGTWPFYKDIDIVNMRVSDGEIVAHLGDDNFTWGNDIGYGLGKNSDGENIDVMTYYPGHYIKRWQDATYKYIQLSTANFDGAQYVAPYYRGTFKAIYTGSKLRSYAGVAPTGSKTINEFRTYARSQGMSIGDWRDFDFLCLYLIKYADYNSQTKVGPGISASSHVRINGLDSAHTTLQGRDGYIGATANQTSVWCLGLCDFWGNQYEFVDGITISEYYAHVCTNPDNYEDERTGSEYGYSKLSYKNWTLNSVWPEKMGCDNSNTTNQLIGFPTAGTGSAITGITDKYYSNTGVRVVRRGGDFNYTTGAGAFYFDCANVFTRPYEFIGCRLLKTA